MKKSIYLTGAVLAAGAMLSACQDSYEDVSDHNNIWNPSQDPVNVILLDGNDEISHTMNLTIAQPVDYQIKATYAITPEKLDEYNTIYSSDAIMLPKENYKLEVADVVINAGAVTSSEACIAFTGLSSLDDSQIYVLPVSVVSANIDILSSRDVNYFVFRGAALINVVGNMTGTCTRFVNEGQCPELSGLRQMTFEVLIHPDNFDNTLSTLLGIEGVFLIRIGDAGIPSNQIQLATSNGNTTDAAWAVETGKWTFLTMTFDLDTHEVNVYFNGVKKGSTQTTNYRGPINWNVVSTDRACYIGYAYDTNRDFQGDMSEMRVWNRILTTSEINGRNHFYRVEPDEEGLVAYWKFNEGSGNILHDYANGYDMYVPSTYPGKESVPGDIKWNAVTLPEQ